MRSLHDIGEPTTEQSLPNGPTQEGWMITIAFLTAFVVGASSGCAAAAIAMTGTQTAAGGRVGPAALG
jgi:hypothetical protein